MATNEPKFDARSFARKLYIYVAVRRLRSSLSAFIKILYSLLTIYFSLPAVLLAVGLTVNPSE